MTPSLFRAEEIPAVGGTVLLGGAEGRHAGSAVRVRPGERIRVGDGRGTVADCEVVSADKTSVEATVIVVEQVPRSAPSVTVVQALPKSERSELAVELATEAGADRIVPWAASRCVSRWTGPKVAKGHEKWTNAARAAAKQSRRAWEPEIVAHSDTSTVLDLVRDATSRGGLALVLHEEGSVPFVDAVDPAVSELVLVVGPEGGVSEEEIAVLAGAGARAVVLGPEVLRTSTAAAVALGALGVLTPRWGRTPTTLDATDPTTRE